MGVRNNFYITWIYLFFSLCCLHFSALVITVTWQFVNGVLGLVGGVLGVGIHDY